MDAQFAKVKTGGGGLRLKGEKVKKTKKHKKSKKREREGDEGEDEVKKAKREFKADCDKHGGWWAAEKYHEVRISHLDFLSTPNNICLGDGSGGDPVP